MLKRFLAHPRHYIRIGRFQRHGGMQITLLFITAGLLGQHVVFTCLDKGSGDQICFRHVGKVPFMARASRKAS